MPAIMIDEGLLMLLKQRNAESSGQASMQQLRLYTAISPALSKASVKANFTEMSGLGYTSPMIMAGNWTYSALDTVNHLQECILTKGFSFGAGAGATILGWYITDTGNTIVMAAEAFPVAVNIPAGGGTLSVTISNKYQNCT